MQGNQMNNVRQIHNVWQLKEWDGNNIKACILFFWVGRPIRDKHAFFTKL